MKKEIPTDKKYLLTIREAAEYFNIGVKKMRSLAENNLGKFSVYAGKRYLIVRPKFEEYVLEFPLIDEPKTIREEDEAQNKPFIEPEELSRYSGSHRLF